MRWTLAALACLTLGCSSSPTSSSPVPPPVDLTVPAKLTIAFVAGFGDHAGHATITATVMNATGGTLTGIAVGFTTDTGTLAIDHATTDAHGVAATTLTASTTAKVTATAGAITTSTLVVAQPVPDPIPASPPPPPRPPVPPLPPPPPPPPPQPALEVTLQATPNPAVLGGAASVTVTFMVTVTERNGAGLPTVYEWDTNGDGTFTDNVTTGPTLNVVYTTPQILTPAVRVRDAAGTQGRASMVLAIASQ